MGALMAQPRRMARAAAVESVYTMTRPPRNRSFQCYVAITIAASSAVGVAPGGKRASQAPNTECRRPD